MSKADKFIMILCSSLLLIAFITFNILLIISWPYMEIGGKIICGILDIISAPLMIIQFIISLKN